jgi:hypothetical protein
MSKVAVSKDWPFAVLFWAGTEREGWKMPSSFWCGSPWK